MDNSDNWKLNGQEEYLTNAVFRFARWKLTDPDWTHDHCEFCWATFSEYGGEDLAEGYVMDYGNRDVWVCPECFAEFQESFHFTLEEQTDE